MFIEGAKSVDVVECLFRRLDGNALFLSGFSRNVTIDRNEFVWIGDGAMV